MQPPRYRCKSSECRSRNKCKDDERDHLAVILVMARAISGRLSAAGRGALLLALYEADEVWPQVLRRPITTRRIVPRGGLWEDERLQAHTSIGRQDSTVQVSILAADLRQIVAVELHHVAVRV
eukprot:CAMPEP_0183340934 /NCGR_PEP_ID=MMETSP0164_2-20130417/7318_1 /TAXON_ID=221442 /ORGANISM="Coccolithus pelagicus ssp braarudi, Strain PLY182g" /LENGTH=122 /DNA_ID=CAMNT_0025511147 /DNA_START=218 /DNA_END=586 /DNA_ORIENTATION=-